ncbi:MAG: hypothetical protein KJO81_01770 [Gammaproteobacteria bacterium]|mgnify:CR=1 FL=1|nr:hypothetical protein [Gammaproteobacteria bacterium]
MKKLKILDVIVAAMFVFGLAFSLTHLNANQETPTANNSIDVSPQQDHLINSVS